MPHRMEAMERRTSADSVFEYLYQRIASLELLPGAKISEAEIAAKFGVSRQPVRDAFSRLGNMDLLLIRPQKATEVRKFSLRAIKAARFARLSIELEVLRSAVLRWDGSMDAEITANLNAQKAAASFNHIERFHKLDYEFHDLLCRAAGADFAYEMIRQKKAAIDRICVLSLSAEYGMTDLIEDHTLLHEQLRSKRIDEAEQTMRMHLGRIGATLTDIRDKHASYFEPE